MRKIVSFVAVLLILAASLSAAKKPSPLLEQVKTEYQGKVFGNKIPIGNFVTYLFNSRELHKLIDTEVYADGSIRYYARAGSAEGEDLFSLGYYADENSVHGHAAGSNFEIIKVEFKGNRIEFWLSGPNNSYAKLKLMFADNFEQRETFASVEERLSRCFKLPRIEKRAELNTQFAELSGRYQKQKSEFTAAGDRVLEKYEAATRGRDVLKAMLANRTEYAALNAGPAESNSIRSDMDEMDRAVVELEPRAREEKIRILNTDFESRKTDAQKLKLKFKAKPVNSAELASQNEMLGQRLSLLERERGIVTELRALNAPAPNGAASLDAESIEIEAQHKLLDAAQSAVQVADINEAYKRLANQRMQALDGYTRSFGTDQARSSREKLLGVLRQMIENRTAAAKLGVAQADAQAQKLRQEMDRIHRQ